MNYDELGHAIERIADILKVEDAEVAEALVEYFFIEEAQPSETIKKFIPQLKTYYNL